MSSQVFYELGFQRLLSALEDVQEKDRVAFAKELNRHVADLLDCIDKCRDKVLYITTRLPFEWKPVASISATTLNDLPLSVRSVHAIEAMHLPLSITPEEFSMIYSEHDLFCITGVGKLTINEITTAMSKAGFPLAKDQRELRLRVLSYMRRAAVSAQGRTRRAPVSAQGRASQEAGSAQGREDRGKTHTEARLCKGYCAMRDGEGDECVDAECQSRRPYAAHTIISTGANRAPRHRASPARGAGSPPSHTDGDGGADAQPQH